MKEQPKGTVIYGATPTPEQAARILFGTSIRGMLEKFLEEEAAKEHTNQEE